MKIVTSISQSDLIKLAATRYGDIVKGVIDLATGQLVLDAEMHADIEQYLLEHGSKQADLWGINLYPERFGTTEFIEFDSMINIRPSQGNRSRDVEASETRVAIAELIGGIVVA